MANASTTFAANSSVAMSDPEQPGGSTKQYRNIQISGTAHLGDTYHIGREDPLSLLPYATQALFNSYDRRHEPACLLGTRADLLQQIYNWADGKDGQDKQCIFWLNGLAGTGKSTISRTIARRYDEQKRLGASFFFSKGGGDVSHAGKFFTSIAVQLAKSIPSLQKQVCEAIIEQPGVAKLSLSDQWHRLILNPISRLQQSHQSYVLIIDALDECEDDQNIRIILGLLAEARSIKTVGLRVILTSRPEIPIRYGISYIPQAQHQDFILHNVPATIINHDISLFLEFHLGIIRQEWSLGVNWPGEGVLGQLILHACGLFIWAETACRFIREGKQFACQRLNTILDSSSSATTAPNKHLDEIYLTVLKHSIASEYSDEEIGEVCKMLKHTLGSLVVLLSPLPASSLSKLLHLPREDIDRTFADLHAILNIPEDPTRQLRLHHPSFRDFLLDKDRCGNFFVDEKEAHRIVATSCIQLMSQTLKKDICRMHAPGSQAGQVEESHLQECLPPEVQYACLYWVQHLQGGGLQVCDGEEAHRFLQVHVLHWLEALGWMGKASEGIQAILSLEAYVSINKSPNLHAFIYDAKRFALYNQSVVEQAPLQLYCAALLFAPTNSIIRRQFEDCIPHWIRFEPSSTRRRFRDRISHWIEPKLKVQAGWNAALQTLEGHSDWVTSVAFSPDGKRVVSGSGDET
ncbi:Vegetative incompatibility protein HET-E-1, partial [Lachnellula suecica]